MLKLISLFFYVKKKNTKEQITDFMLWTGKHCKMFNNCMLHIESETHYMFDKSEMNTDNKFSPNDKHISELYDVFLASIK